MTKISKTPGLIRLNYSRFLMWIAVAFSLAILSAPALAQQAGTVNGQVFQDDGMPLAGVTIEASSSVLPQPRTTTSDTNGRYWLPLLPPGNYEIIFRDRDGNELKRTVAVLLQQKIRVNITFGADVEEIVVFGSSSQIDIGRAALQNTINSATINGIPIGQEYRDIQKLIPGVQYTEDSVRGPSAGGSGQDNSYQFDGVDVSLPMFGTLSAEPSSLDIAQVSIVRGGATAIGFNRSGGFKMNTISKRGTNEFHGEVSYQIQTNGMTSSLKNGDTPLAFQEDKTWVTANIGGPILKDKLYFYTSYYRPTKSRSNASNAYGKVPGFSSTRNEYFGKLTFSPTDNILLDGSYRTSDRSDRNTGVGPFAAASTGTGSAASQDIGIFEGSWIIDEKSSVSVKYTNFKLRTSSRPDTLFSFPVSLGGSLNASALGDQGLLFVPTPLANPANATDVAFNSFIQPIIDQYGFLDNGVATGGGTVGGGATINDQDFKRESFEIAYDRQFYIGGISNDVHIGYQYQTITEDLARLSNGWGTITVFGGRSMASDGVTPIFFEARPNQMSLGGGTSPNINSYSRLQSFEINDELQKGDWTVNMGAVISKDELFGQGLRAKAGTISGFEVAPGNRYKMYTVNWSKMIQPRFGVKWDYSDTSSVYVNFARYNPTASSLARAASWARNLRKTIKVSFDANGDFIESSALRSSSGKAFVKDMDPRRVDEFLVGWTGHVTSALVVRAHARYRKGSRFWEDTNNNARVRFNPPAGIPRELYIANLADIRAEIGGSSFVIAPLDGAFTKYWELSLEAEYTTDKLYISASYVRSHYFGNFDQDNSTTGNDANTFIGSSFIADGAGRQLWNFRRGNLRGDRPHQFKMYGYYKFDWKGQFGAFMVFQSGQPWEKWDSTAAGLPSFWSDTSRFAEPAGSRRTKSHFQLDINYTQNIEIFWGHNIQLRADLFNVFDSQTGYNIQNKFNSAGFGTPRSFFNPRRLQLAVKYQF